MNYWYKALKKDKVVTGNLNSASSQEVVGFLKKNGYIPIEVKNKERVEERDLGALKLFMNKYKAKKSLLLYLGDEKTRKYDSGRIDFVPFWKWLLEQ